jgi:uncharacterized protein YbjT (DUF2867 family)
MLADGGDGRPWRESRRGVPTADGRGAVVIVVTGATGHVGGELVPQLVERDVPVRVVTRRPGAVRFPAGVEVVYGDFDEPGSIEAAFADVDRAFLMSAQLPGSAEEPTHDLLLALAARRAGVRHVVKLSVLDGGAGGDALGLWHRQAEAAVIDSGVDWTMLRPGRFMTNTLGWAPMIQQGDTVQVPFASTPAVPIDPADVAAVAVAALTSDQHRNVAYRLSGPQVLTPADELRVLAEVLDRPLRLVEPEPAAVRSWMLRAGMSEAAVDGIISRSLSPDAIGAAEVLPTVAEVAGRPPATLATWAEAHAHLFTKD